MASVPFTLLDIGLDHAMQPTLQGLLPVRNGEFTTLQKNAFKWPDRLKQAVAVCNALTLINRTHVVGDGPEREAFQAVEAQFLVSGLSIILFDAVFIS